MKNPSFFKNFEENLDYAIHQAPSISEFGKSRNHLWDRMLLRKTDNEESSKDENQNGERIQVSQKSLFKFDHSSLIALYGRPPYSQEIPVIGNHPDFTDLPFNEIEKHYAVSMFVDIKGSTSLNNKYDLKTIRLIKDTVLISVIQICNFFGGHVQRLQGDGVFLYFTRRGQVENDGLISALNAGSLICYTMKYILKDYFEKEGVNPLKVRVGVDYGDCEKVIWSWYGLPFCNELTTTSLHTDLAAKLQSCASANGIMIGDNIKKKLDLSGYLVSYEKNDLYVLQSYRKWEFKWENYLYTFDFAKRDSNQKLYIDIPDFRLVCMINGQNGSALYNQNLYSISKGESIKYEIYYRKMSYHRKDFESIEWTVKNTGKEAKDAGQLEHNVGGNYNNKEYAITSAAFLGHHFMICKIKRQHSDNINLRFPIYVQ